MQLNRRGIFFLVGSTGLLWLAGCGGGKSGSVTRSAQDRARGAVRRLFGDGLLFGIMEEGGSNNYRYSWWPRPVPHAVDGTSQEQPPTFIYNDYFKLWTQLSRDSAKGETRNDLYEDEGKTKPAGETVSTWPTDGEKFPQVWKDSYKITAGLLNGQYGSWEKITNAGGDSHSKYEIVYEYGWKNKGTSNEGANGSSWFYRNESADGKVWNESSGSWRNDGSGSTRMSTSDADDNIFTHDTDGGGSGTVKGPEAGLPATVTWDKQGNVTIRYANGTVETYNRLEINGGGGGLSVPLVLEGDGRLHADTAVAAEPKL